MQSIYYVLTWLCHRTCRHCYDDRFRPYRGAALGEVVGEARANYARIIDHFPERMIYRDIDEPGPDGAPVDKVGRIILAGGEVLLDPVRDSVLYPAIRRIADKYRDRGGVKISIQTTGDRIDAAILDALLAAGLWQVAVSGIDGHHAGLAREDKRKALVDRLTELFESRGMTPLPFTGTPGGVPQSEGPHYTFFGATPDSWIGKLWPRGRAWANEMSTAGLADNFCNRWSGGLNFLRHGYSGSEVSVDPAGDVFPCCLKTRRPLGNLLEENLIAILERLTGHPAYEAIAMGHPERMGIAHGWTVETFLEKSAVTLPSGRTYRNLCIGCDRFHEEVLAKLLDDAPPRAAAE